MRVFIDTRWLSNRNSGVGFYIKNILSHINRNECPFDISLLGEKESAYECLELGGIKKKIFQGFWKYLKFPNVECLTGKSDLWHFTNMIQIPTKITRKVVTVHDLSYLKFPETIEPKNLSFLKNNAPDSIKTASHLIAVSNQTKQDLVDYFKIDEKKISVIYHGPDSLFKTSSSQALEEIIREKYRISKKIFLSVSTLEPRKNFSTLIKAYSMLNKTIQNQYDLIIIGGDGWRSERNRLSALIDSLGLKNNIKLLGYLERKEVKVFFDLADVYIHPSLYEGFGLSLIDAMSSQTPIIASNTSCHPEILGEGALFFETLDYQDLAFKIELLIIDHERKQRIVERALKKLENYSWEKAAKETLEIYKKVLLQTR